MITSKEHSNLLKNYKTSLIINELYSKPKYIKVMFGNKGVNFEYKIDEVNIADIWNPNASDPKDPLVLELPSSGANFTSEV